MIPNVATEPLNLYVGTPYCLPTEPDRCGFCLFPSEVYKNRHQLDVYLEYLRREGEMVRPHLEGAELASIYFGGGTSNLYKTDQYAVLMDIVRGVFEIQRWTPKFGQVVKVGSRPRRRSLACHGRDGVILLS